VAGAESRHYEFTILLLVVLQHGLPVETILVFFFGRPGLWRSIAPLNF
jgi:hypothetical protein